MPVQIARRVLPVLGLMVVATGCAGRAVEESTTAVPTRELRYLVQELCHDRSRLLTGLPRSELTEQEVPQRKRLLKLGQDAYFRTCTSNYYGRFGIGD
ncbi:hypothetical protein [Motiliproteus sediminis]|uniref:hypothetical protein n=1 Tax=Motiliproteus sediminis TaxID=1468178 RepID=UPI001AEFD897|nr:hypothetical protein [Motiliproteus sediminis]